MDFLWHIIINSYAEHSCDIPLEYPTCLYSFFAHIRTYRLVCMLENTSDLCEIPWYITRKLCISIIWSVLSGVYALVIWSLTWFIPGEHFWSEKRFPLQNYVTSMILTTTNLICNNFEMEYIIANLFYHWKEHCGRWVKNKNQSTEKRFENCFQPSRLFKRSRNVQTFSYRVSTGVSSWEKVSIKDQTAPM